MLALDLRELDVEVERAVFAWGRFRQGLVRIADAHAAAVRAGEKGDAGDDPPDAFEGRRVAASKSTRDALLALETSVADLPLRDALARWVAVLVVARLTQDDDVALARAAAEPRAALHLEPPRRVAAREARAALAHASSRSRVEAAAWIDAWGEAGSSVAARARERAQRRTEIFGRLGLGGASPLAPVSDQDVDLLARGILASTRDVARAALADARRRDGTQGEHTSPIDVVRAALARDAGEGWPARLGRRWLEDLFGRHVRGLRIDVVLPREVLGASTFARALHDFGAALRRTGGRGLPFAMRADPEPVDAYRVGGAFAALSAWAPFHRRALHTSVAVADRQARALAFTLLVDLRLRAVAWLLARDASVHAFEELTTELFSAPLPRGMAGAWPWPCDDLASRLLGAAAAWPLFRELVDRYDVDWFENPRAFVELRARASLPAREPEHGVDSRALPAILARAFEEAIG